MKPHILSKDDLSDFISTSSIASSSYSKSGKTKRLNVNVHAIENKVWYSVKHGADEEKKFDTIEEAIDRYNELY